MTASGVHVNFSSLPCLPMLLCTWFMSRRSPSGFFYRFDRTLMLSSGQLRMVYCAAGTASMMSGLLASPRLAHHGRFLESIAKGLSTSASFPATTCCLKISSVISRNGCVLPFAIHVEFTHEFTLVESQANLLFTLNKFYYESSVCMANHHVKSAKLWIIPTESWPTNVRSMGWSSRSLVNHPGEPAWWNPRQNSRQFHFSWSVGEVVTALLLLIWSQ